MIGMTDIMEEHGRQESLSYCPDGFNLLYFLTHICLRHLAEEARRRKKDFVGKREADKNSRKAPTGKAC